MTWQPISETEISDEINVAGERMTIPQRKFWDMIRITPEKWQQHPYGDLGGVFWAVGLIGKRVVWYNDIEEGFNRSVYTTYGTLNDYWCNQDQLEWTIQHLIDTLESGHDPGPYRGQPTPLA